MVEECYLAENKFLAGNSISIADLLCSCELDEMQLLDSVEEVRGSPPVYTTLLLLFAPPFISVLHALTVVPCTLMDIMLNVASQ